MSPKRRTQRHIIIKIPRVKDKERILKAARKIQRVTYKGCLLYTSDAADDPRVV